MSARLASGQGHQRAAGMTRSDSAESAGSFNKTTMMRSRRTSTSSNSASSDQVEDTLLSAPRRASLYSNAPSPLEDLPANPKEWRPSQLASYLSTTFDMPPRIVQDITKFVRESGLTGKSFMRLNADDLEEMGVNVRWRRMLLDARERLRKESLAGRIMWSLAGGPSPRLVSSSQGMTESPIKEMQENEGEIDKENQVLSWRETTGKKSRGSVKGLASHFERQATDASPGGGDEESPAAVGIATPKAITSDLLRKQSERVPKIQLPVDCPNTVDNDDHDQQHTVASGQVLIGADELRRIQDKIAALEAQLDALQQHQQSQQRSQSQSDEKRRGGDAERLSEMQTWTSLGSWTVLATVGIGIVLAETLISKAVRLAIRSRA